MLAFADDVPSVSLFVFLSQCKKRLPILVCPMWRSRFQIIQLVIIMTIQFLYTDFSSLSTSLHFTSLHNTVWKWIGWNCWFNFVKSCSWAQWKVFTADALSCNNSCRNFRLAEISMCWHMTNYCMLHQWTKHSHVMFVTIRCSVTDPATHLLFIISQLMNGRRHLWQSISKKIK